MRYLSAKEEMKRSQAVALLIVTAVLWSLGGILIKSVPWHPVAIAGSRSAIAAIVFILATGRPRLPGTPLVIGCAVAYAGTVTLFVAATKLTTAANAILLQYTAPVYVALLSAWLLKEKVKWADWLTIGVVITGMCLFFLDDLTPGNMLGNIFAVLSGVCFAALVVCMRKQKDGSPLESVLYGNILTFLIAIPFFAGQPSLSAAGWAALAALGVFQLGLSYILYSIAIKHVTALDAVLIPVIEPILNPLWVFLFLAEQPGPWAMSGGAVVLIAVTARCLLPAGRSRHGDEPAVRPCPDMEV